MTRKNSGEKRSTFAASASASARPRLSNGGAQFYSHELTNCSAGRRPMRVRVCNSRSLQANCNRRLFSAPVHRRQSIRRAADEGECTSLSAKRTTACAFVLAGSALSQASAHSSTAIGPIDSGKSSPDPISHSLALHDQSVTQTQAEWKLAQFKHHLATDKAGVRRAFRSTLERLGS
jgi:hypothetical protein